MLGNIISQITKEEEEYQSEQNTQKQVMFWPFEQYKY